MTLSNTSPLLRIGVFYDGTYFQKASQYYRYQHERRSRLSIGGLHDFIRGTLAEKESVDARYCQIVDAHYFRGRISAAEAKERDALYADRVIDDILMHEGVVTHYLPLQNGHEKGIDVWFALEAFELAMYKRFDVIALVAGDGDYVPLVRKLNTLGTRVLLVGFDYQYVRDGETFNSRTSSKLIEECTYPMLLSTLIDDRTKRNEPWMGPLFLPRQERVAGQGTPPRFGAGSTPEAGAGQQPSVAGQAVAAEPSAGADPAADSEAASDDQQGEILNLREGYGFIRRDGGDNLFFHMSSLIDRSFPELHVGQRVVFVERPTARGQVAQQVRAIGP